MTRAVTWLFVPGDRPDRFAKAAAAGADEVVVDLEDAVAAADKDAARDHVAGWLSDGGSAWVRVNEPGTPWGDRDVAALAALDGPGLRGVVVPKATAASVAAVAGDVPVLALVETAAGVLEAAAIAARAARLAIGSIDLAVDLGADESWESLLLARSTLVLASRAAGLPGPVDGVTTAVHDAERVAAEARAGRRLGFAGKLCIHPAQLPAVAAAYAPTEDELAWAHRVAGAVGGVEALLAADADLGPAVQVDGAMVDRPVLLRARDVVRRAAKR